MNNKIEDNKHKAEEFNNEAKTFMEEIRKLDKLIEKKKAELASSLNK